MIQFQSEGRQAGDPGRADVLIWLQSRGKITQCPCSKSGIRNSVLFGGESAF